MRLLDEQMGDAVPLRESMMYTYRYGHNMLLRRKGQGFIPRDLGVFMRAKREGRVQVGRGTYGVPAFHMYNLDDTKLRIGNYSSVGTLCYLGGGHPPDRVTTYPLAVNLRLDSAGEDGFPAPSRDTIIGSDVYATHQTVALSGVTIGDGAIVGIAAVVTKDVPAYAIVGGNPAKLIRYRFSADQIEALLEIRWWDWPDEEIVLAAPQLTSRDVDAFIDYAEKRDPGWVEPMAGVVNPEAPGFEKAPKERVDHITKRLPAEEAAAQTVSLPKRLGKTG
ncbi:MAG TPA: CatB-related O-acetyltransferase [Acidimicrobiales bacterium]|nr:CatB-related O-acetyltransferase [Acidimicrobiales bacterium]